MTISKNNQKKLAELNNKYVEKFIKKAVEICQPEKVTILTDSVEDLNYVKKLAIKNGSEIPLAFKEHSCHFDGYHDQARDKEKTKYLVENKNDFIKKNECLKREKGLETIVSELKASMQGKEMLVKCYTLGPNNSSFSIPALQITDSAYVIHSQDLLYRQGYQDFKKLTETDEFFSFLHSEGELENNISKNTDQRKIYIDLKSDQVFSVNTQYAGNSLGLKKLAFRLAIQKAARENWLAEHMFISSITAEDDKKTYFAGAFPSGCGKTSTAMIPGQKIVGDDLAYLKNIDGTLRAVNVERGIFGIIDGLNEHNNPVIYQALKSGSELIFSNILINEGKPYWQGMGEEIPVQGQNFVGSWFKGKKDEAAKEIPASHPNARFTLGMDELSNCDPDYDQPAGVEIEGIIFGGRDSDTSVPVAETFNWKHGVFVGATLESETTAATLGNEILREHNPMAILDFLSIPLADYIANYIKFGKSLTKKVKIFTVNYFLKNKKGEFRNGINDKKVWLLWMEGRINNRYQALKTPIGYIPLYEDLQSLFKNNLNKDYQKENYIKQFSLRIDKNLNKLDRIEKEFLNIYKQENKESLQELKELPAEFAAEMALQRKLLNDAREKYSSNLILPTQFIE